MIPKIYSDKRENKSKVVSILKKKCDLKEKILDYGDYRLSEQTCIERKTTDDFVKSIIDKRLFRQLDNMEKYFKNSVIMIEGSDIFDTISSINPNAIRGALASITIDYNVSILWTKTQLETANMIFMMAKREQFDTTVQKSSIFFKKKTVEKSELQEMIVSSLPGINQKRAGRMLLKLKTVENIFNAKPNDLEEIHGIGSKLASEIRNIIKEKYVVKK